jgi:hypothetical protein
MGQQLARQWTRGQVSLMGAAAPLNYEFAMYRVTPTRKMDILHIRRYSGMYYDDIVGDIIRNHNAYGSRAIASDFGVGAYYLDPA